MTKLPNSKDPIIGKIYNSIWVDIYRFICFTILAPILKEYNENYIASLFVQKYTIYFGIPEIIITDRDTIFISKYQQIILSSLGTKLKMSTAYYLETNGQTKRMNQIVQNYLRIYINTNHSNQIQLLPLAQIAINNRIVGSIKQIPQSYIFRFNPIPYELIPFESPSKAGLQRAKKQTLVLESILLIKEPQLKKGNRVYLSIKNLKTLALSKKFNNKKIGPFTINKILRPIIYKLKLLLNIGIYLVFYQSLLESIINKETGQGGYWKFE